LITDNCKTCTPCEGCDPAKIVCEEGIKPCDICDPCNSNQRCSYCDNHLCKCDSIIDTDDGPMHSSCAAKLSWSQARISELEEDLAEAKDIINRLVAGDVAEWDLS
jgi:hypothetical protein